MKMETTLYTVSVNYINGNDEAATMVHSDVVAVDYSDEWLLIRNNDGREVVYNRDRVIKALHTPKK